MIHPTAIVDPLAQVDRSVSIGPYAVVEGAVHIGPGCEIQAHAKLMGPLTMGSGNIVHSFASLGDLPQDLKFSGQDSCVTIGDGNIFREHVTVHRGTGGQTTLGSNNFLMVASHVGHNCRVGNHVTLVNGALLGGHVEVNDRAIIGGNCAVHQFCRIGRLAMISLTSAYNVDVPPFCMAVSTNLITQLNFVGLRRSGMSVTSQNALRRMFRWIYRTHAGRPLVKALDDLPPELDAVPEIQEFMAFVKSSKRGVARFRHWSSRHSRASTAIDEADGDEKS